MRTFFVTFVLWIAIFIVAGAIFVWSGSYNIGADKHQWPMTTIVINTLRDRFDRRARRQ